MSGFRPVCILTVAILVSAAACLDVELGFVRAENPLFTDETAFVDERLIGKWVMSDCESADDGEIVEFGRGEGDSYELIHDSDDHSVVHLVRVGQRIFLDLAYPDRPGHFIALLEQIEPELVLSWGVYENHAELETRLKANGIPYTAPPGSPAVLIRGSAAELQKIFGLVDLSLFNKSVCGTRIEGIEDR